MSAEIPKELLIVRINIDGKEAIANLYGIGPQLAKRVVEYREANGYFYKPEDLANVKGVSYELAKTLSPHIDWQIPKEQEQSKPREWMSCIVTALGIPLFVYLFIIFVLPVLIASTANYSSEIPVTWGDICATVSLLVLLIGLTLMCILLMASYLTTNLNKDRRLTRLAILSGGTGLMGLIFIFFMMLIESYVSGEWRRLLSDPASLLLTLTVILAVSIFIPILLMMFRPTLKSNRLLLRIYDAGIAIGAPCTAFLVWNTKGVFPIWVLLVESLFGFIYLLLGLTILLTGHALNTSHISLSDLRRTGEADALMLWLNINLPDVGQQKALKTALHDKYPPSRKRTLVGTVVLGSGVWLIVQALGAVYEWIVQRWLNQLWP